MIADGLEVKLALSLHAPNQALRERIMPIAKAYPLDELMRIVDEYVRVTDNRLFYEYIMINGVNDLPDLAHELGNLLSGRLAHVNLIPYNENPALDFGESDEKTIRRFQSILDGEYGVTTTVRASMGRDAKGACGQLGYEAIQK
jgi:23S rRNA (adenine2503-C2)-methyltransferase